MAASGITITAADRWLEQACARNVAGEVHFGLRDGTTGTCRIRLREVTPAHVVVDVSRLGTEHRRIPSGVTLAVHVLVGGSRFEFESIVELPDATADARRDARDGVARLRRPVEIKESQRRSHLRISVAGLEPIDVWVAPTHPDYPEACPIDARPLRTTMINISASGVGVMTEAEAFDGDEHAPPYFLSFSLPGVPEPFEMLGKLRYVRYVDRSRAWRLGFAFRRWSGGSFTNDQYAITRFITEQERRLLRRRR